MMSHAKNYYNRPMFHGAIPKNESGTFYGPRCTCETLQTDERNKTTIARRRHVITPSGARSFDAVLQRWIWSDPLKRSAADDRLNVCRIEWTVAMTTVSAASIHAAFQSYQVTTFHVSCSNNSLATLSWLSAVDNGDGYGHQYRNTALSST